jgi:hypothetical protein
MYVSFEQLPPDSRLWIYQAARPFTETEEKIISNTLKEFCGQWSAHGDPLETSFLIKYQQFIILSVNENSAGASGCSIDGSVRVLKELSQQFNNDFFNRTKVAFANGNEINLYSLQELSKLFESGALTATSQTFDNLVPDKGTFEKRWKIEVEKTWLAKYLPKGTLSI